MASKLSKDCNYWMKLIPLCAFTPLSTSVQAGLYPLWFCLSPPILKVKTFVSLGKHPFSVTERGIFLRQDLLLLTVLCASFFPFGKKLAKNCNKTRLLTFHMFLLPLQLEVCQSEWKYFLSQQVFTDGSSIYALLCTFLLLSHRIPLNSLRELILSDAFKPTEQPESGEKKPTLLRDDPRHTADTNWLPSHQENNPQTLQLSRNKILNVRYRRLNAFSSA